MSLIIITVIHVLRPLAASQTKKLQYVGLNTVT